MSNENLLKIQFLTKQFKFLIFFIYNKDLFSDDNFISDGYENSLLWRMWIISFTTVECIYHKKGL